MARASITLTIDDGVLEAVRRRAASTGRGTSEVIEEAVRNHLGIGFLASMTAKATLGEEAADALAVEAQHRERHRRS